VVIRGARKPLKVDLSSSIDEEWGTMDISLIPTPCPAAFRLPADSNRTRMINIIPDGAAVIRRFHPPEDKLPENFPGEVFIKYLLIPICNKFPDVPFFIYLRALLPAQN
jgi:hypothetical protein